MGRGLSALRPRRIGGREEEPPGLLVLTGGQKAMSGEHTPNTDIEGHLRGYLGEDREGRPYRPSEEVRAGQLSRTDRQSANALEALAVQLKGSGRAPRNMLWGIW